jgi:ribosome-binding factor A
MNTTRQNKIAQLVKKELADIFLQEGTAVYGCMITVTQTYVTSDLSIARSHLSIFNASDPKLVLDAIRSDTKQIRFRMSQKLKNQLRIMPRLEFFLDDSLDYIEKIDALLKK